MSVHFPYPAMPKGVDEKVIQPSPAFKKEVVKVTLGIVGFLVLYLMLLGVACALAAVCGFAGFALVSFKAHSITLMLGLGLVGLGLMVNFFLVKFLFSRVKTSEAGMIEVKEEDQPILFAFIRQLTQETQAPFPKKIFLSANVNASVFYNSSFWSMFFPVRKNLQIGLGLVNSVNVTEFKAILAHEFGHFSQRSMKLGSYVYNMNRILYNLLYDNDDYNRLLTKWSNMSGYFALFAKLTICVVQLLQWILQKAFVLLNKNYLSLSRQMEFHADSVAAFVTGSEPLVTSLYRLEVADLCYGRLMDHYNEWLQSNLKADNVYQQHKELMHEFAEEYQIPNVNGLPQVNAHSLAALNQSRFVIKDQWASHPNNEDREAHLKALNIPADNLTQSAWVLFGKAENLQKQMTDLVYENAPFEQTPETLGIAAFRERLVQTKAKSENAVAYNGFYDNRSIHAFDVKEVASEAVGTAEFSFDEIFSEEHGQLSQQILHLEGELNTLEHIRLGSYDIKTFDFDGQKYSVKETTVVHNILQTELAAVEKQLQELEKQAFKFFYRKAEQVNRGEELLEAYQHLFQLSEEAEKDMERYRSFRNTLNPVFQGDMSFNQAKAIIRSVEEQEIPLKIRLQDLLNQEIYAAIITQEQQAKLDKYIASNTEYMTGQAFNNEALHSLTEALDIYIDMVWQKCFQVKKDVLALQIELKEIEATQEAAAF